MPRIFEKQRPRYLRFCFGVFRHGLGLPPEPRNRTWFWRGPLRRDASGTDNGIGCARKASERGRRAARDALAWLATPRRGWVPRRLARARASRRPRKFSKNVLASPSEFPYSTSSHGGVAQLGERLTGSQEVRGSIPLVSTRALNEAPTQVGAFFHIGTQGQRRHHDPPGRQDRKKLRRARPL